jgi:hypothetical protein
VIAGGHGGVEVVVGEWVVVVAMLGSTWWVAGGSLPGQCGGWVVAGLGRGGGQAVMQDFFFHA